MYQKTATIDPRNVWNFYNFSFLSLLFNSLIELDSKGNTVSGLAKSWVYDEDTKQYTFWLDEGLNFSDNNSITSEDVAFSISRHFWPDSKSVLRGYLKGVIKGSENPKQGEILKGIKILNNQTLTISLNHYYRPFLKILSNPGFGVISKKAFEQNEKLLGSGKYILSLATPKKYVFEAREKKQNNKCGNFDKVVLNLIFGDSVVLDSLNRAEFDVIAGAPANTITKLKLPSDYIVKLNESMNYNHLFYNLSNNKLLNIPEFRNDLSKLVRHIIVEKKALGHFQKLQNTYFPEDLLPLTYYQRNLGFISPIDFKEKWKPFKPTLKIFISFSYSSKKFIEELSKGLTEAGILIEMNDYDGKIVKVLQEKKYDIFSGVYFNMIHDPDGFIPIITGESGLQFGDFNTTELKESVEKIKYINGRLERLNAYQRVFEKFEENNYFVPMFREILPLIYSKRVIPFSSNFKFGIDLGDIKLNHKRNGSNICN